jgi:hypothetical protein
MVIRTFSAVNWQNNKKGLTHAFPVTFSEVMHSPVAHLRFTGDWQVFRIIKKKHAR